LPLVTSLPANMAGRRETICPIDDSRFQFFANALQCSRARDRIIPKATAEITKPARIARFCGDIGQELALLGHKRYMGWIVQTNLMRGNKTGPPSVSGRMAAPCPDDPPVQRGDGKVVPLDEPAGVRLCSLHKFGRQLQTGNVSRELRNTKPPVPISGSKFTKRLALAFVG